MTAEINLGNYEIDEDGSGNLVIKDSTGTTVLTHTDGGDWSYGANVDHGGNDVSNVGALETDALTNVFDHITTTPESTIENDLSAGESVAIGPGTHSISLDANDTGITISQNDVTVWLHPGATIKLADGQTATDSNGGLISIADGVTGVTLSGSGTIDGNKANNTNPSDPSLFALIRGNDNHSDIEVSGLTIKNAPGDAIHFKSSVGNRSNDIRMRHLRWEDCVEGVLWTRTDDVHLSHFVARNMTAQDAVEPVQCDGFDISHFVIDTTQQSGIDVFDACSEGTISDGVIRSPSQAGTEAGLGIGGNGAACSDIKVDGVSIYNSGNIGVIVRSNGAHESISLNQMYVEGSASDGYQIGQGVVNMDDCDAVANDLNGINHQGDDSSIRGGEVKNNSQTGAGSEDGIVLNGANQTVESVHIHDDQTTNTQRIGVLDNGTDADLNNIWGSGHTIRFIGGNGTRTRWNGVIKGGPMGGVDLTTVTGQFEGDQAMSNGTNTTAYLHAVWTGTAWQPSDGGATI